jgi:hypothetical protein
MRQPAISSARGTGRSLNKFTLASFQVRDVCPVDDTFCRRCRTGLRAARPPIKWRDLAVPYPGILCSSLRRELGISESSGTPPSLDRNNLKPQAKVVCDLKTYWYGVAKHYLAIEELSAVAKYLYGDIAGTR